MLSVKQKYPLLTSPRSPAEIIFFDEPKTTRDISCIDPEPHIIRRARDFNSTWYDGPDLYCSTIDYMGREIHSHNDLGIPGDHQGGSSSESNTEYSNSHWVEMENYRDEESETWEIGVMYREYDRKTRVFEHKCTSCNTIVQDHEEWLINQIGDPFVIYSNWSNTTFTVDELGRVTAIEAEGVELGMEGLLEVLGDVCFPQAVGSSFSLSIVTTD